ncbi:MAG: hypothetical protein LBU67_08730 [Oscillospiraceae bacterium]|jgi:hypothetical protein|nr:hypothetical protein [Oscillospiraceae bacterium]
MRSTRPTAVQKHRVRRVALCLLACALMLALAAAAQAVGDSFVFPYEGFKFEAPVDWRVLTQHNLDEHLDFLTVLGTTPDATLAGFQAQHVVMELYPPQGGQLSLSLAPADGLAEPEALQAAYAAMPRYQDVAFSPDQPGWLRMTFSAQQGDVRVYTLRYVALAHDQQYVLSSVLIGRQPAADDDALVRQAIAGLSFLSARATPTPSPTPEPTPAPTPTPRPTPGVAALVTQQPGLALQVAALPAWTDVGQVRITGSAQPDATVRALAGDKVLDRMVVGRDGAFALAFTLDAGGAYTLRVEASRGDETAYQDLALTYDKPVAAITVLSPTEPVERAETAIRGVTVPLARVHIASDILSAHVNANAKGEFSIRLKLDEQGDYPYTLTAKLDGYEPGQTQGVVTRHFTYREAFTAFRVSLAAIPYKSIVANPAKFKGKHVSYRARIVQVGERDGMPLLLMNTETAPAGEVNRPLWVISDELLTYQTGDIITAYLELEGTALPYTDAQGDTQDLPVARLVFHGD